MAERRARLGAPRLSPLPSMSDRVPDAHMEMMSSYMHCAADMPLCSLLYTLKDSVCQGKGVNTKFILSSRGLTRAVTMSSLLERHAGIREMMDKGDLVPDTMVGV